ncbi:immunity repressor [Gordonia phage Delian]|uniref:transcriptional repressor n=1 Tax=Gordonia phage CaptainKirk2 TaxID=1887643 RepID=UPI00084F677A|nr:transcriptional repressor [Gordonia phage CaptainKirk2]AXH67517.1 immunity repressor [Gordonia phage Zarbodnamra]QDH85363.1 immunity repressor [Gordonia phage MintFen]QGH77965.1 immunity repressor [Gordonia phage Delian]QKO02360.1 immunity repressor [Gordonia phage BlingBling]QNJ58450.1 immunity repressor [Gordonia phage Archis]
MPRFACVCHALCMTADAHHGEHVFPTWTLGDRIRKTRAVSGLDQRGFADALGVKPGSLAGWETDRQRPRDVVALAKRIEMITRVPAEWVLGLRDGPDEGDSSPLTGSNRRPLAYKVGSQPGATVCTFPSRQTDSESADAA